MVEPGVGAIDAPPFTDAEIQALRDATPGCAERIHLNNAGSSLLTETVLDAQVEYLRFEAVVGGYEAADARQAQIAGSYEAVAALIGARPSEIAMVENATVAWNQAFHSLRLGPGDRVITAEADYGANFITYLQAAQRNGVDIAIAASDAEGGTDPASVEALVNDKTELIAITHAPTNGGLVNPAAEIGAVAQAAGVPYLLDACQSVGQLDLDVETIGCDFLSATGRKYLRGPRGTGFLYASERILERVGDELVEPAMLDHHGADWTGLDTYRVRADARRFENWEFNYASLVGLGQAATEASAIGMGRIQARVEALADYLRAGIADLGLPVFDLGRQRCGLVTTALADVDAFGVKAELANHGINVSTSTPNSTLVDATRRGLPPVVRLSVHYYNTESELDTTIAVLAGLA